MKQSTIDRFINPKSIFNSTNQEANIIGNRIDGVGIKNILYWFKPIEVLNIVLLPIDGKSVENESLRGEDFEETGALYDVPMNHYLTIRRGNKAFYINAAFVGKHFMISERAGYRKLKQLITHALNNPIKDENLST